MTSHCVIKFKDEFWGRIAPTELIKLPDKGGKFLPKSAKDLPEGDVRVKWQNSFGSGSFSNDGYYEAQVLAIGGSVKTAESKATELGLKLYPGVLSIPLPASSDEKPKSSRRSKSTSLDTHTKSDKKDHKPKKSLVNEVTDSKSGKTKSKSKSKKRPLTTQDSKTDDNGQSDVKKRLKLSPVALERTSNQTNIALSTNPLLKNSGNSAVSTPKEEVLNETTNESETVVTLVKSDRESSSTSSSLDGDFRTESDNNLTGPKFDMKGSPANSDNSVEGSKDASKSLFEQKGDESEPITSLAEKTNGKDKDSSNSSDVSMVVTNGKDKDSSNSSDNNSDTTTVKLETSFKSLQDEETSESSDSNVSSDGVDPVYNLASKYEALKKKLCSIKGELADSKRDLTLTNNLRLAHLKELKSFRLTAAEQAKEIACLQKRNGTLQDLLSGTTGSTSRKSKEDYKPAKGDTFRTPTKRVKTDPFQTPTKVDSMKVATEVMQLAKEVSENEDENTSSPASPIKASSSSGTNQSLQKKGKKRKDHDDMSDAEVCAVAEKVLSHLQGKELLKAGKDGFIEFGNNIKIHKERFENILKESKGDISKISKGMASLVWTTPQRLERSLTGGKNNRFPNAPVKKMATPCKVNTCLGVVKAHLLNQGDKEGAGMALNLKTSRKNIGEKFAQDAARESKKKM